jgi:uncharacterized protein YukE
MNHRTVDSSPTVPAIGDLASDMEGIETDIEQLIADIRASINEADNFLKTMPE